MMRTHRPGELRSEHVGRTVTVCGWVANRRDHGGVAFLDVRDATGVLQVVVDPAVAGLEHIKQVRSEWVLRIEGAIRPRPDGDLPRRRACVRARWSDRQRIILRCPNETATSGAASLA